MLLWQINGKFDLQVNIYMTSYGLWFDVIFIQRICVFYPQALAKKPCRQDRDRIVSSWIIQLGILDHHNERKKKHYCFSWSTVKVIAFLSKKPCRQDRDRTVSSKIIELCILDHHYERKNTIVFQGQRSRSLHYLKSLVFRIETEP